jgi:hypothetical protein
MVRAWAAQHNHRQCKTCRGQGGEWPAQMICSITPAENGGIYRSGRMATKATSTPSFSTGVVGGVAFRSVHGQFGKGTLFVGAFSDLLGWGAVQGQQQPVDGLFAVALFCVVEMASRQHHPCGNAKVRLQASTRGRRARFIITRYATPFASLRSIPPRFPTPCSTEEERRQNKTRESV